MKHPEHQIGDAHSASSPAQRHLIQLNVGDSLGWGVASAILDEGSGVINVGITIINQPLLGMVYTSYLW